MKRYAFKHLQVIYVQFLAQQKNSSFTVCSKMSYIKTVSTNNTQYIKYTVSKVLICFIANFEHLFAEILPVPTVSHDPMQICWMKFTASETQGCNIHADSEAEKSTLKIMNHIVVASKTIITSKHCWRTV